MLYFICEDSDDIVWIAIMVQQELMNKSFLILL